VFVLLMMKGHLIPAADTALLLHSALCTIVDTPATAVRVRPTIESAQRSGLPVRLEESPLDYTGSGMPEDADSGDMIPATYMQNYFETVALLRAHAPYPTCVVSDFCHPWPTELTASLGVPRLSFFSMCAFCLLCQHNVERFNAYDGVADDNLPVVVPGLETRFEVVGIDRRLLLGSTVGSCWDRPSALEKRSDAQPHTANRGRRR
jgi:UDP-glucosyltransferase 73C